MNAASFFSLEAPVGAAVPAETDAAVAGEVSTSGNADVFAALVDEAFVRTAQGQVEFPVLELAAKPSGTSRAATTSGTKSAELPEEAVEASSGVEEETSSPAAESSEPERPKPEPLPGLDILLLSQSFFVAPTLPVTWLVPAELPVASSAEAGDEPAPAVVSAVQGETQSSSEEGDPAPISSSQTTKAQAGQTDSSNSNSRTTSGVRTGNAGRLDLVELGFQPVEEEYLPSLTKSPDASAPQISTPTVAPEKLPELVSPGMEVEVRTDGESAWPQPLSEGSSNLTASHQPPVPSSPDAKVTLPTPVLLPDVPAVTANALRFATVAVVPVPTLPVVAEQGMPEVTATEAELPSAMAESAIVAQSSSDMVVARNAPQKSPKTSKAPADAGLFKVESAPAQVLVRRGTPAAKEELRMESLSNAEQAGPGPMTGRTDDVIEASPSTGAGPMLREQDADNADFSRNVGATDWQTGRPVSRNDRLAPDSQAVRGPEAARTVEQLSGLVMRETAVLQQHTPDSMAVVLRPDANTELFLHLTQRDGQIEASVRCERGNFDQLNALWPQLQESLAGQKVRLAPLQESTEPQRDSQGASGHPMNFSESEQRSRRQSMPEDDSTSDRPSSAPPSTVSLHPERRRSGTRPTASRPGWETWA